MEQSAQHNDRIWHAVNKIKNIRNTKSIFESLVSCNCLSSTSDSWEPLSTMNDDDPAKVRQYFKGKKLTRTIKDGKSFARI